MAEDYGDKTESPTPRRRMQAREEGNVARSPDISAAVILLAGLFMVTWFGQSLLGQVRGVTERLLSEDVLGDHSAEGALPLLLESALPVVVGLVPLAGGLLLAAVLANLAQVGFFLSTKRLKPNLGALNPTKGVKRLFGQGRAVAQLVMSLLKLTLVSAVAYSAIAGRMDEIVLAAALSIGQIFGLGAKILFDVTLRIGLVLLVLAIVDYAYQRWKHEQELKMTKQQVKDEMRNMEGDPLVKQRRRQIAMQRTIQRIRRDVPTADVVVTNPTEFAVALRYDAATMRAPRVVAKGQGYLAQRIRETAAAAGVPILERKPLARALYRLVEVGQEIPEQFYAAVAEILAYVYELTGRLRQGQPAA